MAVHVLGNGPSIEIFDRNVWPENDLFVGCNFSDSELRPDYTVMVDVRPMKFFYQGTGIDFCPTVLSEKAHNYIKNDKKGRIPSGALEIKEIIQMIKFEEIHKKWSLNSGQHATMYVLKNEPHEQIHLWGIDTFWTNALKSNSDAIVRPNADDRVREDIADPWRQFWRKIFNDHTTHRFYIHAPMGATLYEEYLDLGNVERVFH